MNTCRNNLNESKTNSVGVSQKKKQHLYMLALLLGLCMPLFLIIGCGPGNCLKCVGFGDDSNRIFVCASGNIDGTEYTSCVGPAGILGFGCNNSCWPTECVKIKNQKSSGSVKNESNGCITFYHGFGCIDGATEKSKGKYSNKLTCLGCACSGETYVEEDYGGVSKATKRISCFGINCGSEDIIESQNRNANVPRQFSRGCWISEDD